MMKFTVTLAAFAGLAAAQSFADLPPCSQNCLSSAITSNGKCALNNLTCFCALDTFQNIITAATPCFRDNCGEAAVANQVFPAAAKICNALAATGGNVVIVSTFGVTISSNVLSTSTATSVVTSALLSSSISSATPATSTRTSSVTTIPSSFSTRNTTAATTSTRTTSTTSIPAAGNSTATTATGQVPVTVNGAAVQGPAGIMAVFALGLLAYL
ncbi:hypothetical protein EsH8_I_001547 [Colletotrichum jinshuiense]